MLGLFASSFRVRFAKLAGPGVLLSVAAIHLDNSKDVQTMSDSNKLKKVVIIGGGGAGAIIARTLSQELDPKRHSITLLEKREFYLHYPAALRMLVSSEDHIEEKALMPYKSLLVNGNGVIVHEKAAAITSNSVAGSGGVVTTDTGKTYPYDVLVIASGSLWEGPLALPPTKVAAIKHIEKWREIFKSCKGVAIAGGGAVGAELAGEIRDAFPNKKVTIVQRGNHLLTAKYPEKFRSGVDKTWGQRKIDLILDDELVDFPADPSTSATVTTKNGVTVDADLVISARGGRPNTAILASLGDDILTPSGHVKVESSLQVKGLPGVFAAGDIIDWKEVKQLMKCMFHASTVTSNVKNFLDDKPPKTVYKTMFEALALSSGKNGGSTYVGVLWGLQFGDSVTRAMKSKNMFIDMYKKNLGL